MIESLKAFVFDMDGTLIKSDLNFDLMREEMQFPQGAPILEYLATLTDEEEIKKANEVIHRHELEGAKRGTLFSGVESLLKTIKSNGHPLGLITRNSTEVTDIVLEKFNLSFDIVFTRDNCKPKPDPEGLLIMAKEWNLKTNEMIYIGDFLFDLKTAQNAGAYSGLYLNPRNEPFKDQADFVIEDYSQFEARLKN